MSMISDSDEVLTMIFSSKDKAFRHISFYIKCRRTSSIRRDSYRHYVILLSYKYIRALHL